MVFVPIDMWHAKQTAMMASTNRSRFSVMIFLPHLIHPEASGTLYMKRHPSLSP